jgi:hypothetical protein
MSKLLVKPMSSCLSRSFVASICSHRADAFVRGWLQYADRSLQGAETAMANFLVAVNEYSYFGIGGGWGGPGPSACASWLHEYPEYSKPLGAPFGDAAVSNGTDGQPAYSRHFASGTSVYSGQFLPPIPPQRPQNHGACIFWSDGSVTGNATRCPPKRSL